MRYGPAAVLQSLKALTTISWLSAGQLDKLSRALKVSRHEDRSMIISEALFPQFAHILLSGVARITCGNRKGQRAMVIMVAPGVIPAFPRALHGISYDFRCEAVSDCQVGTVKLNRLVEICLGIKSAAFEHLAANLLGRWDRVQLRCANFMNCTLAERLALVLLDLSENFGSPDGHGKSRLNVAVRHGDLAELIGASRPRVTEHLLEFAGKHLISRQKRRLMVDCEGLRNFLKAAASA